MQSQELFSLAEAGDTNAQFHLGAMFYEGRGAAQDYAKAADWFGRSAGGGYHEALNMLGVMHYHGQGVRQDFTRAADCFRLAERYSFNDEPLYDDIAADWRDRLLSPEAVDNKRQFLHRARVLGGEARYGIGSGLCGTAAETAVSHAARGLFGSAAALGNGRAMYSLGVMCRDGQGVRASKTRALMWFMLADRAGLAKAREARAALEAGMQQAELERAEKLMRRWLRVYPADTELAAAA
ncbi:Sel1 domain protein repeat-containing protein [Oleidesulfovibrio alaskensis G20]|jgi:TPR repeat protein|uniref:Sel1 domain protein repeat-containing protein n=1 Tax=Oleidesulfovibrio alaskensis (strain ATCC BAA-1058 / DSM 17464 / G20) TaxID=207559 RepID=Q316X5_OLEA2|nr:tetratricopeptide repeat protein [Oleidesulfovibrio alaskensis]ABB37021.2 Sel1 domain protein repeat-containing protein [Oleidesulfovibrio alaskensis G20]